MLQAYEMFYKDGKGQRIPNVFKFHALITTYEVIISDCELLSDIEWRVVIIDEAHRLKNAKCKLMEGLRMFDCVRTYFLQIDITVGFFLGGGVSISYDTYKKIRHIVEAVP